MDGQAPEAVCPPQGRDPGFPARHPEVPEAYREIGQPVLIPGDMGRYLHRTGRDRKALTETFGSTCHGAGRLMSGTRPRRWPGGDRSSQELAAKGIVVRGAGRGTIDEEISEAYKDVSGVVDVVHGAGIARRWPG